MPSFRFTLVNRSAWPLEAVWANAMDLEHVAFLHRRTNIAFRLLDVQPAQPSSRWGSPYEAMSYLATRRFLGVLPITGIGVRRVTGPGEILQVETSPLLGITTVLKSRLRPDPADPRRTELVDEVDMRVPAWMAPFRRVFEALLRRHTRIQCEEDESFRARWQELAARGIRFPNSVLNASAWEQAFGEAARER